MSKNTLEADPKVYEIHAEVCKALAHPARLAVLDALRGGPKSPSDLADIIGISRANLAQHVAVMRDKGLLRRVRAGRAVAYTVSDVRLFDACSTLRRIIREQLRAGGELAERGFGSVRVGLRKHVPGASRRPKRGVVSRRELD